MSNLFKSISKGLDEAIEHEKGNLPNVKIDRISISPLPTYTSDEIKQIRMRQNMTQRLFAEAFGVSIKTVEAWETGTNSPSGVANRMLELLELDSALFEKYSIVARS